MAAKTNPTLEIALIYERDTKMKQRFEEVVEGDTDEVCGKIYISKKAAERLGNPKKLNVRIEGEE